MVEATAVLLYCKYGRPQIVPNQAITSSPRRRLKDYTVEIARIPAVELCLQKSEDPSPDKWHFISRDSVKR